MIRRIKLIRNIGTFESDSGAASLDLKRLSLIYAENGRGKTTLAAILRSLGTGDSLPIVERRRLGSQHTPHVILECDGDPSNVMFQDGEWNRTLPELEIFDDVFVDNNVFSGLDVDSRHRQSLHGLILGEQGVVLGRRLDGLVSQITEHNKTLSNRAKTIPEHVLGGLSVEEFCALPQLTDIDSRIEEANRQLNAARDQEEVLSKPLLKPIELLEFNIEAIEKVLAMDLSGLDQSAEARVQEHVLVLGEKGETWLSEGMEFLAEINSDFCPFCGQDVKGQELVNHYREYFSEGYSQLKQEIETLIVEVDRGHSGDVQAAFERTVASVRDNMQFWANYCDLTPIAVDTEAIAEDWQAAWKYVADALRAKRGAPLDKIEINGEAREAVTKFNARCQQVKYICEGLTAHNVNIQAVKEQVESADVDQLCASLAKFQATKECHSETIAPLCAIYLQEVYEKAVTEAARDQVRKELDDYRTNVFPQLQESVNSYLKLFNAGFRICELKYTNIGGGTGSSCTYNVVINEVPVAVKGGNVEQGEHSFKNTLSAGDRNTLALALFFSSLDKSPNLENKIVVLDDPISSLDDHRSFASVQRVRKLAEGAGQVILLSHNKHFLSNTWNGANRKDCRTLEISRKGNESTVTNWDVSTDTITEHDRRHNLLLRYVADQSGDKEKVAMSIRPHIEGYLRVAFPGNFPNGKLLASFIEECRNRIDGDDEILPNSKTQELQDINEYGKRFHHEINEPWESGVINSMELQGFVKRTLAFTRPSSD